jgi:class 3 adenylate cyclase/tetratricopeptide (TPR) repeat protein
MTSCSACRRSNPDDARFCMHCAAPLAARCAQCGADLPVGARFCPRCAHPAAAATPLPGAGGGTPTRDPRAYTPRHLAEKILTSRVALEGERKQVTVLFADVKGSMDLAEQLDPEAWHGILDRFLQLLAEGVHRFEGTVNQYTGDGIMALFGAPIAHEDHAQRACWAALHLRETLRRYADDLRLREGLSFSVRMGLNSGQVVVGRIGDDLRMDYTAQGHTVGLAQRMEQLAEPGTAYLTEHTARLVTGYFRLRDLGPLTVRGATEPVHVHELEGAGAMRTRLDRSKARGFSRFVGRADEMATLEASLEKAMGRRGQVVGVVAEAGVGKSRLCWEFAERCRARGVPVYESHAVAHGKSIPFLPVMELLRNVYGVTEHDRPQTAREKITGRLLLLDEEFRDSLPLIFDFLGVADPAQPLPRMDPEARQRRLFAVWRRAVQARSQRETVVTLIEDLHWLDAASETFLEMLVDVVAGARLLLLLNFRPEYHAGWMQRSYYQQLPLQPLGGAAVEELLRELLGPGALDGLAALVRARTGGNPFFVEEVVQALVDSGVLTGGRGAYRVARPVETIVLPPTVQTLLAARIDRLAEREKAVLQTAAVIGQEFAEPVLRRVMALPETELGAALRTLVAGEFLYEEALYPEAVYSFKHPLTQEVAYGSQLAERRRRSHAAVARAIEETHPATLDEQAALLALHWEGAGEALVAATWHERAAEWVGARDRRDAFRHWQRVAALVGTLPDSPEVLALGVMARDAMLLHGLFLGMADDEAAALLRDGVALTERLPEPTTPRVRLLLRLGARKSLTGAPEEARLHAEEALALADRSGNQLLSFLARFSLQGALVSRGRLREALSRIAEAEALCGGDPEFGAEFTGFSPYGMILGNRATGLRMLGRAETGARELERAMEIARGRKDHDLLVITHGNALGWCELSGDSEIALAHARQAAEAAGTPTLHASATFTLGRAQLVGEQWREAVETLAAALAAFREGRTGLTLEAWALAFLAEAYLGAGELAKARTAADEAVAVARRRQTPLWEIAAHLARARVLLGADGTTRAQQIEEALRSATALVDGTEARWYSPLIHVERARLMHLIGDHTGSRRELAEAQRLLTEMGAVARAEQVAREMVT